MIKFALRCDKDHGFESWFRDNRSFDELSAAGHVTCPACGSAQVSKALMAPAVVTARQRIGRVRPASAEPAAPDSTPSQPVAAVSDERGMALRAALRELRDHLVQNSQDVGPRFATEARRMHEGQSEKAAIHGQASGDEVRALIDDGIDVTPLPIFPDERN